jgi:ketosteroid isomerase-like protein
MPSQKLALVHSIFDAWERGDFSRTDWASPEIEFGFGDGPDPQRWTGIAGMTEGWFTFQRSWESLDFEGVEFRELDAEHVLVSTRFTGRTRGSALDLSAVGTLQACLMEVREGRVARLLLYWHAEQALADLGLAG